MRWAVKLSGYPEPKELPTVTYLPREMIAHLAGSPGAVGLYVGGDVVYVAYDIPTLERDSVVIHEMTHYLQMLNGYGGPEYRCGREIEANRVEWSYKSIVGDEFEDFKFDWEWYRCPKPPFNG